MGQGQNLVTQQHTFHKERHLRSQILDDKNVNQFVTASTSDYLILITRNPKLSYFKFHNVLGPKITFSFNINNITNKIILKED